MSSVDEGSKASKSVEPEPTVLAAVETDWRSLFGRGEQIAAMLDGLRYGRKRYNWEDDRAYRSLREGLLRTMRTLGSVLSVMRGEPIDEADALMARLLDETFPQTLADRYENGAWRPDGWERLQGTVLTIFDAVGFDPVIGVDTTAQADEGQDDTEIELPQPPAPARGTDKPRRRRDPRKSEIAARRQRVRELSSQHVKVETIAHTLGVHVRTVYSDRAALRNEEQGKG
jgi:hypothetical protein